MLSYARLTSALLSNGSFPLDSGCIHIGALILAATEDMNSQYSLSHTLLGDIALHQVIQHTCDLKKSAPFCDDAGCI